MTPRRLATVVFGPIVGIALALTIAAPASAVTVEQKAAVLSSWTQPNSASYNAWNAARLNQGAWAAYGFDWGTDYCSDSPDQPLGFDFRIPCWHHDFGYRNYKNLGTFSANKSRLDDMLYFDLKAKCATYNVFVRPSCTSLAWTYYQAVKAFGGVAPKDIAKAQALKNQGLRDQAEALAASH